MTISGKKVAKRLDFILERLKEQLVLGRTLEEAKLTYLELFDASEIDEAIEVFKASDARFRSAKEIATLHDEPNYAGWYGGPALFPGSVWSGLVSTLKNKSWSDQMVENLDLASTGVVEQLAPPKSSKPIRVKGLVLGYVQSGKTANYSAAIAKAVDAGYKLVIVLSGMHNNLRKQTQERLKNELVDPNPTRCTTLTSVDEKGDFQKKQNVVASRALSVDGFTLVVLKKNASVLRNFHAWLDSASEDVIRSTPTLIIDDESDQASINTAKAEEDPTAINSHLRKLMTRIHVCSFVGYTATPFANVLVDAQEDSDVFPRDFLISLGKPPNYFGAEELFGRDKVGALQEKDGLPVVRLIPNEESERFSAKNLKEAAIAGSAEPLLCDSMKSAVDTFVVACAARICRGQHKKHMTMLLHVSHLNAFQAQLKAELDDYLKELKFAADADEPDVRARLDSLWTRDFLPVSREFPGTEPLDGDKVWKYAKRVIQEIDTVLENSESLERLSFEVEQPLRSIVIGGNTLSRGLTLEGLTVSYFLRTSKAYDTLLQMGRWFGYRPGYIDLTRIFVTQDLRDYFFHLATVEQEIRDEIKVMAANEERPIDVGLRIRNHPHMTVTASNKMRRAKDCAFTYSGTKIQARHLITQDQEVLETNYSAIRGLYSRCKKFGRREGSALQEFKNALLFRRVSFEVVLQFLDDHLFSPENGRFTNALLAEYISNQAKVGEVVDWSVAFLSSQQGTKVDLGGETVNVFDRSVLKQVYDDASLRSVQLRALSTPGDELVDLGDRFEEKWDRVSSLLPDGRERESEIALRLKYRPAERGLLLVYPLNWCQGPGNGTERPFSHSEPLNARGPVFGITFVFPFSGKDQSKYGFVANSTVTGPRAASTSPLRVVPTLPEVPNIAPLVPVREAKDDSQWRLSKSQYVKGRKCLRRVWLYNHKRDLADDPSEMQELLFRQGTEVGVLAQKYFERGHLIDEDFKHAEAAMGHTRAALKDASYNAIFEAAFKYDGVLIRVDVLRKNKDGSFDLIEVKSTNSVKKEHKDDLAVQKFVLEGLGYQISASYLMHLNPDYIRDGELNLKELFVLERMDEEIEDAIEEVPNYLRLIRTKLGESEEPKAQIGSVCKSPYTCEFRSHCWKNVDGDSIHKLAYLSEKKRAMLVDQGIEKLTEIPDSFELTDVQAVQVKVAKTGKVHHELARISEHLKGLKWPLHFLDYETIPFAVPRYDGSSPYQQLPFQFSMHIQRKPGGEVEHFEFINRNDKDPRESFIEQLLGTIDGDRGSIVVYHAGFERNITDALKKVRPDLADAFDEVTSRMWDLETPFAKKWYYDHRFEGSSSIKYVLPVLVPELSYKDLEIQKGDVAQKRYGELIQLKDENQKEKIAKALLAYCNLDTLAMVRILERLMKVVRE